MSNFLAGGGTPPSRENAECGKWLSRCYLFTCSYLVNIQKKAWCLNANWGSVLDRMKITAMITLTKKKCTKTKKTTENV